MTAQQQAGKITKWVNVNTIITGICTTILIWVGTWQVKVYNAILLQAKVDERQDIQIIGLQKTIAEKTVDIDLNKLKIQRNEKKIAVINAIFPMTKIEEK